MFTKLPRGGESGAFEALHSSLYSPYLRCTSVEVFSFILPPRNQQFDIVTLLDKIYAGTEAVDNPETLLGGIQSMPSATGGTEIQSEFGNRISTIQEGPAGHDVVTGDHGNTEGYISENPMGGHTYLDENMNPVMHSRDAGGAQEAVFGADGSQLGTVGPDGTGGEEFTGSLGEEVASSTEMPTGQEIEFGGEGTAGFESGGIEGADLADAGAPDNLVGMEDVGDVGEFGDAADVADLEALSDTVDLGGMV